MKNTALLMMLFAALLFASCGGAAKNQAEPENDSTETVETEAQEEAEEAEEPAAVEEGKDYKGELGLFELRGPVKSCTWKNSYGSFTRTFDENGMWLTHTGKSLKAIYPSGIKRDAKGRIVKGLIDADGNGDTYAYNEDGSKKKATYAFFDTVTEETCTYDDSGKLTKMHVEDMGMDGEGPYNETYEDLETDSHGNWTKRKVKGGPMAGTVTRKIEYF